ncbi:MAG TPA: hypothetical protein VD908_14145 [Cytophagales bacterium]|nr:hypothetical protein [Cytophagales bacterium]
MNIRRVKEADLENLLSLYEHLHQDDIIPSKEILNKTWQTIIKYSDFFIYLIAEKDGEIVSSCNLTIVPNLTIGSKPLA